MNAPVPPESPAMCSQCGKPFAERACGPTHALIWAEMQRPEPGINPYQRVTTIIDDPADFTNPPAPPVAHEATAEVPDFDPETGHRHQCRAMHDCLCAAELYALAAELDRALWGSAVKAAVAVAHEAETPRRAELEADRIARETEQRFQFSREQYDKSAPLDPAQSTSGERERLTALIHDTFEEHAYVLMADAYRCADRLISAGFGDTTALQRRYEQLASDAHCQAIELGAAQEWLAEARREAEDLRSQRDTHQRREEKARADLDAQLAAHDVFRAEALQRLDEARREAERWKALAERPKGAARNTPFGRSVHTLYRERDELRRQVEAVRAVHVQGRGQTLGAPTGHCVDCHHRWPCPTIAALAPPSDTEGEKE